MTIYYLSIGNIDGIEPNAAIIEIYLPIIAVYLGHFSISKSVLYNENSAFYKRISFQYTKRCFIYRKFSFLKTINTKQKYDKSKKKFVDHYPNGKTWLSYGQKL